LGYHSPQIYQQGINLEELGEQNELKQVDIDMLKHDYYRPYGDASYAESDRIPLIDYRRPYGDAFYTVRGRIVLIDHYHPYSNAFYAERCRIPPHSDAFHAERGRMPLIDHRIQVLNSLEKRKFRKYVKGIETEEPADQDIVWWDSEDDPANPLNWSAWLKWMNVSILAVITFIV
jgi:hypothetical protein